MVQVVADGSVGKVNEFQDGKYVVALRSGGTGTKTYDPSEIRQISTVTANVINGAKMAVNKALVSSSAEAEGMVEAVMMCRAHKFFHFFANMPGSGENKAFALGAYATVTVTDGDRKCDYAVAPDGAHLVKDPDWSAHLKSISSKGGTFALFDRSDDAYGRHTNNPRRELGILSFSYDDHKVSMPLQVVVPKVDPGGNAEQFVPSSPDQSMAAAYQKGEHSRLVTLNGAAEMKAGGVVALDVGSTRVFEANAKTPGFWSVRYRHPLSPYQAFSIAISVLHNPKTAFLDTPSPSASLADGLEREALQLAAEARGAVDRPGVLKAAHDKHYKPVADELLEKAIKAAVADNPGSKESFTSELAEILNKVGLGDRLSQALSYTNEKGITSLIALLALLELQDSQWAALLKAVGPTKSVHKMRIKKHLKKMVAGKSKGPAKTASEAYWAKLDNGSTDDADEDELTETDDN